MRPTLVHDPMNGRFPARTAKIVIGSTLCYFSHRMPRTAATRSTYLIRDLRQLGALESPIRAEIVDTFAASSPCSVATVAHQLGRTPESLYFHVKQLVAVGLLRKAGERVVGKTRETLYATQARELILASPGGSETKLNSIVKIMVGNLKLTERDVERSFRHADSVFAGEARNVYAGRSKGWLTDAQRREATRLLDRLGELMKKGRPGRGRKLFAMNVALTPIEPRQSARTRTVK
jgi:predicted transcriptional regulator